MNKFFVPLLALLLSGSVVSHAVAAEAAKPATKAQPAKAGKDACCKKKAEAALPAKSEKEIVMKKDGLWVGDKIRFSGQVRVRPEYRHHLTQAIPNVPTIKQADLSVLLRSRFGILFNPTEHVSFFIQGQDARDFGETVAATPLPAGDAKGMDLHQGYVDITDIGGHPLMIRAGRQEVKLGEERLVGAADWTNVGRSLDAIVLSYQPENWGLTALGSITNRTATNPGDGQYLAGLYSTCKKFPGGVMDAYYLLLEDNNGAAGAAAGTGDTLSVHTFGTRIASKFKNGLDLGLEGALQLGKFGSNSIFAFAGHGAFGYTFDAGWKPRLGVEYNYATGDNAATAKYTKFNNLLPTNHNKYGMMDINGWSNMHDGSVMVSVKPGKYTASAAYHLLAVDKNTSAGDTFAGFYAGGAGLGKIAGHEVDLQGKWVMNENFEVGAGVGHFIPGSFLKNQGMNKSSDFVFISTQAQF